MPDPVSPPSTPVASPSPVVHSSSPTPAPASTSPVPSSTPTVNELGIPTNLPSLAAAIQGANNSSADKHTARNLEPSRGGGGGAADATNHAQRSAAPASAASDTDPTQRPTAATQATSPTVDGGLGLLADIFKMPGMETEYRKPTPATSTAPATTVPNGARVFDGLNEEEAVMFKQMSNTAYAKIYPAYLEAKKQKDEFALKEATFNTQLAEASKARFYDHENAYVLDPEIQQLSKDVKTIEDLEAHFEEQLANIEGGKPWQGVMSDGKGGLVMTQPQQPTVQDKIKVIRDLQSLAAQKQFKGAEVQQRINNFRQEFSSVSEKISALDSKIFGPIAKAIDPQADAFIKANFPKAVHNKSETRVIAKSAIVIDQLLKEITRLRSVPAANPNAGALASGSPTEGRFITSGGSDNPTPDRKKLMALIDAA